MLRWLICVQLQKCVRVLFYLTVHLFIFRQTCEENRSILTTSLKSVALCCQGCSLFCIVARFFQENASKLFKISDTGNSSEAPHEVESESLATADTAMFPPNLFAEWQEFFSSSLFNTVLRLFMFHAGESRVRRLVLSRGGEGREESVVVVVAVLFWGVGGGGHLSRHLRNDVIFEDCLLMFRHFLSWFPAQCQSSHFEVSFWSNRIGESLGKAVIYTPTALLKEHKFEGPLPATPKESSNMPQWIGDLLENCLPLLKCSLHSLQFAGYHLLSK